MPHNGNGNMTAKHVFIFLAGLAGVATLHAAFVVPTVLASARKVVVEEIDRHGLRPHDGAISRTEFTLLTDRLDKLATAESVQALRESVRALSDKMDRLEK